MDRERDAGQLVSMLIVKYSPLYFLCIAALGLYLNYTAFYVYPLVLASAEPLWSALFSRWEQQAMTTLLVLWACSVLSAIFTDAGAVHSHTSLSLTQRKRSTGQVRYCRHCQSAKPDDCHHCAACKSCVLGMDHHSVWLATCVGAGNSKPYFLALLYGTAALALFVGTFWRTVRWGAGDELEMMDNYMVVVYTVYTAGCGAGVYCLGFHLYMFWIGKTTIAYTTNREIIQRPISGRFVAVFGRNPLLWLLPWSSRITEPKLKSN